MIASFCNRTVPAVGLLMVAAGVLTAGCSSAPEPSPGLAGTTVVRKTQIKFNGLRRSYRIHVPSGYEPQNAMPLVIVIHGAFSTAKQIEKETGFSRLADRHGFIVSYPNGIGIFGFLQHWNAGHCCGKAAADGIDDIGFIDETIADASGFLNIDPSRIYMTGFSNGGMFTHRYGAERASRLAAIAPLAGPAGGRVDVNQPEWHVPRPQVPLPVVLFHGTGDEKVPYQGGAQQADPEGRQYHSALASANFWAEQNACDLMPLKSELRNGRIEITSWLDCSGRATVELYALDGWGHRWPGPFFTDRLDPQDPLHGFDAAEIVWRFFDRHQR